MVGAKMPRPTVENCDTRATLMPQGCDGVRRRHFIKAVFVPAILWPLTAWAQKQKKPVIGLLASTSADAYASRIASIRQGLGETGFVEGQNVTIEYQWAEGQYDRLPAMAADLVRSRVDVILAITTPAAVAAKG